MSKISKEGISRRGSNIKGRGPTTLPPMVHNIVILITIVHLLQRKVYFTRNLLGLIILDNHLST